MTLHSGSREKDGRPRSRKNSFSRKTATTSVKGYDHDRHVHFYSPSTWLEKFWVAQRARTWRELYEAALQRAAILKRKPRGRRNFKS